MIYIELFWEFLKIGLFTFGGGYGGIPLIQDTVQRKGWLDISMFTNIIAVSESTPGPIIVNTATYVGKTQAGLAGSFLATLGVILPSFICTLLILAVVGRWFKSRGVQTALRGIKPAVVGIILAAGISIAAGALTGVSAGHVLQSLIIAAVLLVISVLYKKKKGGSLSPISLILAAAVLGMLGSIAF